MFRPTTSSTFKALLSISLVCIAILAAACHHSGEPSTNSSASKPAASSDGAFEGMIAMKMESELQKGMEMVYFLKGSHSRVETKALDVPEANAVMLWDMEGGKIITLMPARKMYMTMDLKQTAEDLKNATKEMKKGAPDETKFPKLTATGKQETIAGYPCEHWLMGEEQNIDMCVAKGLGYFGAGGKSGGGGLGALRDLAFDPKLLEEAGAHPEWKKLLEGGAFPLKFQISEDGKVKMTMEATKIEKKSLDDSLFVIPPDYKEMSIPRMSIGKP